MVRAVIGVPLPADTNESHNPVTGLPAPLRVDTWLACGNGRGLWVRRLRVGFEIGWSHSTGAQAMEPWLDVSGASSRVGAWHA